MTHSVQIHRRQYLSHTARYAAAVGMAAVWGSVRAQSPANLRLTPAQSEGPFYPDVMPQDTDFDLLRNMTKEGTRQHNRGQATWLTGRVTDVQGKPVAGAVVEIWQCDHDGHYHHSGDGGRADPAFQGFGKVQVGADGSYKFRTLRPAQYSGRTPHIHVKVKLDRRELLTTQLYVAGDPGNERDGLWRQLSKDAKAALTVPFAQGSDGLQAQFAMVVAA